MRTRQAGDAVNIYVEDNGIGIPEDALHKLGRPFEQVETEFSKSTRARASASPSPARWPSCTAARCASARQEGVGTIVLVHLPLTEATHADIALADAAA